MIVRTWQYGTRKTGVVCTWHQTKRDSVVLVTGDDGEGYILIGERTPVDAHQRVVIEFTRGGPTGGYWKIVEIVQ